jgi:hypothetical protein
MPCTIESLKIGELIRWYICDSDAPKPRTQRLWRHRRCGPQVLRNIVICSSIANNLYKLRTFRTQQGPRR